MSTIQTEKFQIHNYDSSINAIIRRIEKEVSPTNLALILKYHLFNAQDQRLS